VLIQTCENHLFFVFLVSVLSPTFRLNVNVEHVDNCNITIPVLYAIHMVDGTAQANQQPPGTARFEGRCISQPFISFLLNDNKFLPVFCSCHEH
jgi:hypothetical protein